MLVESKSQTVPGSQSHHTDTREGKTKHNKKQTNQPTPHQPQTRIAIVSTSLHRTNKNIERNHSKLGSYLNRRIHQLGI